jgi:hypothetical protein
MEGEHLAIVHLVNVISGQNQDGIGITTFDFIQVLIDGISGPLVRTAGWFQDVERYVGSINGFPSVEIFRHLAALVVCKREYRIYSGMNTIAQAEINYPEATGEYDRGFWADVAQDVHSFPSPPGENDCGHFHNFLFPSSMMGI